jgi:hypothetical protein
MGWPLPRKRPSSKQTADQSQMTLYWQIIADELADMGWSCDYCPVDTPEDGVLISAYADKAGHHCFAQAETKMTAFVELQAMCSRYDAGLDNASQK